MRTALPARAKGATNVADNKRQNPVKAQMARVGNYVADVDTAGIDPAMKQTMGIGVKPKKPDALHKFLSMFGMGPKTKK